MPQRLSVFGCVVKAKFYVTQVLFPDDHETLEKPAMLSETFRDGPLLF